MKREENFLGEIGEDGTVLDLDDEESGFVDIKHYKYFNISKDFIGSLDKEGNIYNFNDQKVGEIHPFLHVNIVIISAYLYFFNIELLSVVPVETDVVNHDVGVEIDMPTAIEGVPDREVPITSIKFLNSKGKLKTEITSEGELKTNDELILGFMNPDGSCGDSNEEFLGEFEEGTILNEEGEISGFFDTTTGIVTSKDNNHLFTISATGNVLLPNSTPIGKFEPHYPQNIYISAGYIFFFEKSLLQQ